MNAHLKLSPNPFTIDAVQSGRYLHMHMSIECVLAVLQPTTYIGLPPQLVPLLFFGLEQYVCVCSGLGSTTTHAHSLTGQGVRAIRVCVVSSTLPGPHKPDLPRVSGKRHNNNKASPKEKTFKSNCYHS